MHLASLFAQQPLDRKGERRIKKLGDQLLTDKLRDDIVSALGELMNNENPSTSTDSVEQVDRVIDLIGIPIKGDSPRRQQLALAIRKVNSGTFKPKPTVLAQLIVELGMENNDDLQNNADALEAMRAQADRHTSLTGEA